MLSFDANGERFASLSEDPCVKVLLRKFAFIIFAISESFHQFVWLKCFLESLQFSDLFQKIHDSPEESLRY